MSGVVAHPWIVPLSRVVPGASGVIRRFVLGQLRASWDATAGARIDLVMPGGGHERLGGRGPADATIRVHDDAVFQRLLVRGELGGGEAFVAGEWTSDDLVGAMRAFLRATAGRGVESFATRIGQLPTRLRHRFAANTRAGSERNIHAHYDLGNAFYRLFLDEDTMLYSCALFSPGDDLAQAQRRKLDRLCDALELQPGDHLLEIGCGWGGMAIHAARTRGCRVTAITVSRAQHDLARQRVAIAGVDHLVDVRYLDYRDLDGRFDKIVSIEMIEAVGFAFLPAFFATCARVLRPGGRLAVQSITMPGDRFETYRRNVDWMQTYIFPGSCIPSVAELRRASAASGWTTIDALDIGTSYAPTLRAWRERFAAALAQVRELGFDAPFVRAWTLYLAFSEAAFAERTLANHQIVMTR